MKRFVAGACDQDNIFDLVNPTGFLENEFEVEVIKALNCLASEYQCGVFAGSFVLEGDRRIADLALIHRSLSHWFVIEVELAGHSLDDHILPQVRCFRYGEPEAYCVTSLVRGFVGIDRSMAESLLRHVPRYVAVIGNLPDRGWSKALNAIDAQLLTVYVYRNRNGVTAHEVEGKLVVRAESLGFAQFSAIDNCIRIRKGCGLQIGRIQIIDQFGNVGDWTVRESSDVLWISKFNGPALIPHKSYVQIIRDLEGRISIRLSG